MKKAEKALLAQFAKEISSLAKARTNPETRLHLVEAVKAEKAAFETRKLIPWSPLDAERLARVSTRPRQR